MSATLIDLALSTSIEMVKLSSSVTSLSDMREKIDLSNQVESIAMFAYLPSSLFLFSADKGTYLSACLDKLIGAQEVSKIELNNKDKLVLISCVFLLTNASLIIHPVVAKLRASHDANRITPISRAMESFIICFL